MVSHGRIQNVVDVNQPTPPRFDSGNHNYHTSRIPGIGYTEDKMVANAVI